MADNKRQHTVPQFYLRHFTDADGCVHVLDTVEQLTFATAPVELAVERDCYTITTGGQRDPSCDDVNQAVESWCAPRFQSLSPATPPSNEQWQAIWILTANLLTRSRRWRDHSNSITRRIAEVVEEMTPAMMANPMPPTMAEMFGMTGDWMAGAPDAIRRVAEIQHPLTVAGMITHVAEALRGKPCQLLIAPEGSSFITSDDPVVVIKAGVVVATQVTESFLTDVDLELYLPLQPGISCRWGTGPELKVLQTSLDEVVRINRCTRQSAYRQLYACSPDLLL